MWNPQRYLDTDHGLAPGEAFEPVEIEDTDRPGPDQPHVRTVLGRIAPEDVGIALMQEHLLRRPRNAEIDETLTGGDAALTDLETFFSMGGRTVVEATRKSDGRDPAGLLALAQRVPMHLVASAAVTIRDGAFTEWDGDAIRAELLDGMDGSGVLPGIVDVWFEGTFERRTVHRLLEALGKDEATFLLPMRWHASGPEILQRAIDTSVNSMYFEGNIILAGSGFPADAALELIDQFGFFQIDGWTGDPDADTPAVDTLAHLIQNDAFDAVLFGQGFTHRSQLHGYGGRPGLTYIFDHVAVMLLERGVSAQSARAMLVDNTSRALTISG